MPRGVGVSSPASTPSSSTSSIIGATSGAPPPTSAHGKRQGVPLQKIKLPNVSPMSKVCRSLYELDFSHFLRRSIELSDMKARYLSYCFSFSSITLSRIPLRPLRLARTQTQPLPLPRPTCLPHLISLRLQRLLRLCPSMLPMGTGTLNSNLS